MGDPRVLRATALGVAALASLLLVLAELATLYEVHAAGRRAALSTVTTGSHNSYALIPIAVLAALLALGAWRSGGAPALVAIAVLGAIALLIGLFGDLPDAHSHGYLTDASGRLVAAATTAGLGLYLETLGAVALLAAGVCGLMLRSGPDRPC